MVLRSEACCDENPRNGNNEMRTGRTKGGLNSGNLPVYVHAFEIGISTGRTRAIYPVVSHTTGTFRSSLDDSFLYL